jgi:transposase-like protein
MGTVVKRVYSRDFKLSVARQLVSGQKRLSQVCREHSICESVVRRWQLQYESRGENAWTEETKSPATNREETEEPAVLQARVRELEAALGRAHLEIEFLKLALEKKPLALRRALK